MKKLRGKLVSFSGGRRLMCKNVVYVNLYESDRSPIWCTLNSKVIKLKWFNFAELHESQLRNALLAYAFLGPNKLRVRHIGDK